MSCILDPKTVVRADRPRLPRQALADVQFWTPRARWGRVNQVRHRPPYQELDLEALKNTAVRHRECGRKAKAVEEISAPGPTVMIYDSSNLRRRPESLRDTVQWTTRPRWMLVAEDLFAVARWTANRYPDGRNREVPASVRSAIALAAKALRPALALELRSTSDLKELYRTYCRGPTTPWRSLSKAKVAIHPQSGAVIRARVTRPQPSRFSLVGGGGAKALSRRTVDERVCSAFRWQNG